MARTATRVRSVRREAPTPADFNRAVKDFLKAVPFDHLDRRLTELERYVTRLQKDMTKLMRDMGPRRLTTAAAPRPTTRRKAVRRTTARRTTRTRHAAAA